MEGAGAIGMATLVRRALRMNADRVIVGEVLGDEVIPMLNAMSQGRSGSMCTIHADSSAGVFRRLASYAVQAPEHLPLEATTLLVAGAVHFVVFLDVGTRQDEKSPAGRESGQRNVDCRPAPAAVFRPVRRRRFVSSIREVVDADGMQVVSNEVFKPGRDRSAVPGAPLRSGTLDEMVGSRLRATIRAGGRIVVMTILVVCCGRGFGAGIIGLLSFVGLIDAGKA